MKHRFVVTAAEMRAIEAQGAVSGNTSDVLMERAGKQIADRVGTWLRDQPKARIVVFSGPGNNGGDGLVAARDLSNEDFEVRVLTWGRQAAKDTRLQRPLEERSIDVTALATPLDEATVAESLAWCNVIVDGLLGTGIKRPVEGDLAELVRMIIASGKPVVSIDIPTGVDSDTGAVLGVALHSQLTVALGHLKYGHLLQPGAKLSGTIELGDIGLSTSTNRYASGELLTDEYVSKLLPDRPEGLE